MGIVSFFLLSLILEEKDYMKAKKLLIYVMVSISLFFIGFLLSFRLTGLYYGFAGAKSFTFSYGFIGGVVELGTYLLFALFPLKFLLTKKLNMSLRYILKICIIYSLIGGLVQGSYAAGWQNLLYV